ncbi:MAG: InlB B-repeat-containing protein [Clostridiales bacterium]|nr:InlB B-repeat-containing protein [Clostridiales bacterium]
MSKKKAVKKNKKLKKVPPKSKSELRAEAKAREIAKKKAKLAAKKQAKARLKAKERAEKKKIKIAVKNERLKKKYPYVIPPRNAALTRFLTGLIIAGLLLTAYFFFNPLATVRFDSKGGSDVDRRVVWKLSVIEKPDFPVREGYVFEDWYEDPELQTKFDFTSKITADTTLYAKWIPFNFPINVVLNGGGYASGAIPLGTFTVEEEITLPGTEQMYKEGFIFAGWYTDRDFIPGTEIAYIPAGTVKPVTIFAKWIAAPSP